MKNLKDFNEFVFEGEMSRSVYKKKLKKALSKIWSFAPENPSSDKKTEPDYESIEGKMSVAPDGKPKEDTHFSYKGEEKE
jgi:hypothetical protein